MLILQLFIWASRGLEARDIPVLLVCTLASAGG